ncbi:MAG: response regulator [Lachnospiraceae bacterium]|nr:response regulator [Lachnospiraceae bacterium]
MKLKVLVTGKNRKVVKDICEHLEYDRGYITVKCAPSKAGLFDIIMAELPKVAIICTGDETEESVSAYDVLKNAVRRGQCTVIVIANRADEKTFMNYSEISRLLFLSRPISLFSLYEKLTEIEEDLEKRKDQASSSFEEYINENAEKETKKKRVLVVDDDSEQLIHIKEQLEEFYEVTLVKNGDAMFKFLEKRFPDIILLDYLMPEKNGPDVYRELKEVREYADIPVVFLTGVKEKSTVLETLLELRPQGYVIKPAKKSELVAKIIDVLG